jgi:hypothetical protein
LKPTLEGERRAIKREKRTAKRCANWRAVKTPSRDFFRGSYEQTVRRAAKTPGKAAKSRRFRRARKKQTVVGES